LGGDLAEIGALKQLEIARLRFVRAQSRLEQMGLLPRK
jgi:hypothetical protein